MCLKFAKEWRDAKTVAEKQRLAKQNGVMWSVLYELPGVDLPRIVLFDVMHQVFLGVTLSFLRRLFSEEFKGKKGNLSGKNAELKKIEGRIKKVNEGLPSKIGILKPDFIKYLDNLTAAEVKVFLFIYSGTVLKGIVDDDVYSVWTYMLFSFSIFSARTITQEDITKGHRWYLWFLSDYAKLFGKSAVKPNFHFCEHMKDMLLDYGPLSSLSCWVWERFNKLHKQINTNNKDVELQMMRDYVLRQGIWDVVSGVEGGMWGKVLSQPVIDVLRPLMEGAGSYKESVYSFCCRIPLISATKYRSFELRGTQSLLRLDDKDMQLFKDCVRRRLGPRTEAIVQNGVTTFKRMMVEGKQVCASDWREGDKRVVRNLLMRDEANNTFIGEVKTIALVKVGGGGGDVYVCVRWRKSVTDKEWEEHKRYPGIVVSTKFDGEATWWSAADVMCPVLTVTAAKNIDYVVCLQ